MCFKRLLLWLLALSAVCSVTLGMMRWQGYLLLPQEADPPAWEVFGVDVSAYQGRIDWQDLREQGVEQIQFVTSFKTTTLSVEDLLAEGGSWFALEHDGLVSRQLSAAQAESLKCWMH